ncbi:DUF6904 family protein [Chryseobacterium sp. 2987]|uniref:DUF6904 family protein n=1 Tax=Chryseobacterium sp. 2987 TaxID=2817767 RepID=UPI00286462C1|nr:hypothetical protein [Chryseobacterium sp. 2987]MDR6919550.1 hypothetical protein [Chryseobacterium sp. 2987]
MLYIIPTKHGLGAEIWGTFEDLNNLYDLILKFWGDEDIADDEGYETREKTLSGLSYEIRKAKDGMRLKRDGNHFIYSGSEYYGTTVSWVQFLFSLTALKFNMRYSETCKFDISQILLIEYWLERAMHTYDEIGAVKLKGFLNDALFGGSRYLYLCMRSVNFDFLTLGGGKRAFRKLPDLLRRGIYATEEYWAYEKFLIEEANKYSCQVSGLEFNDDDFDYGTIRW